MKLPDRLHCPNCKDRLTAVSADALRCPGCERTIQVVDGIADFVGGSLTLEANSDRYHGDPRLNEAGAADLLARILTAAGDRWPNSLGDTIEFGCGRGETTHAIAAGQRMRSLLVLDTEIEMLQACRTRLAPLGPGVDHPVGYATLGGTRDAIRDAVADTVIGTALLSGIGDVRAFLAMVYRALKPNGRAAFVVPNRRYHEAMCLRDGGGAGPAARPRRRLARGSAARAGDPLPHQAAVGPSRRPRLPVRPGREAPV